MSTCGPCQPGRSGFSPEISVSSGVSLTVCPCWRCRPKIWLAASYSIPKVGCYGRERRGLAAIGRDRQQVEINDKEFICGMISSGETEGECPMQPQETELMLKGYGQTTA